MLDAEETLRSAYCAFNARDIDAAVELMHPEVNWPNAWEGGRIVGRAAVRDYWNRQFAAISSNVEPQGFTEQPDGSITVDVHQVVRDAGTGELISDSRVRHRYRLENGLVVRMDVLEPAGGRKVRWFRIRPRRLTENRVGRRLRWFVGGRRRVA